MVLPNIEYEFIYTIEDNNIYVDFVDESAKDAEYMFEINENSLILEGGNISTKGRYVLTKEQ